jgi:DNA mismatch repair protein MutS
MEGKGMIELYQGFYKEAKEKYGDKIVVLMQVGKFFEMYDSCPIATGESQTNIREASALLEISVSETPISVKKGVPTHNKLFSGFPDYVVKKYERILVRQGYRGVFITQEKEGKVYKREVSNIVSAGTFAEEEADYGEPPVLDRWLWAFFCEEADDLLVHSAAISCATGKIIMGNTMMGSSSNDDIYLALSTYEPAEVIVWYSGQPAVDSGKLREMFHLSYDIPLHIRPYEAKKGAVQREEDILIRAFAMERTLLLAELQIDRKPDSRRVLAHLLSFVEEHNPALIKNLKLPTDFQASEFVRLGNHTLEQVGMINKNKDKQNECYFHYFNKVQTACGRRALRQRLLQPLKNVSVLRNRIAVIDQWRTCAGKSEVIAGLKKVYDIEKLYRRLQLRVATVADIWKLLSSLYAVEEVIAGTEIAGFPETDDGKAIRQFIKDIQQRWNLNTLAIIRDNKEVECMNPWFASPVLESLENQWTAAKTEYANILAECRTIVPDAFQPTREDDRPFAVYATKTRCDKVLKAKVLTPTLRMEEVKGHYYLRSDEIDSLNKRGLSTLKGWEKEWTKVWQEEIVELGTHLLAVFPQIVAFISETDVNLNLAVRAEEYGYCSPVYEEGDHSGVSAEGLRHGILERIRRDIVYVPHTVALGSLAAATDCFAKAEGGILLFGVNSSGKSSLMKAIGLSVLMAQAGCPVPATEFRIVPYSAIFTRILGNDNLWAGMSSFVVEMTEFRNILEYSDAGSLVLGDELCAGTETSSAASLVAAGLECLLEKRASFFFATHLHELQRFPELMTLKELKWLHLRVRFDAVSGTLIYDRDLQEGCGQMNYGLEVCRALRMPTAFLDKATAFRRRLQGVATTMEAPQSRYNSSIIRRVCSICKNDVSKELEVHHIVHQESAIKGFVAPGIKKNHAGNLTVLCEGCHTKHHTGQIEIIGWQETSAGKVLVVNEQKQKQKKLLP